MNYYRARRRGRDGRWEYTAMNDHAVWPVGYCAPFEPWTKERRARHRWATDEVVARQEATAHKHHSRGHATEEEACACYEEYCLDHLATYWHRFLTASGCEVCGTETHRAAMVDGACVRLCEFHCNREGLERIWSVGQIVRL